jgi:hypothetical protein
MIVALERESTNITDVLASCCMNAPAMFEQIAFPGERIATDVAAQRVSSLRWLTLCRGARRRGMNCDLPLIEMLLLFLFLKRCLLL